MRLRLRLFEIAQSNGFRIESWIEDGLGQAHGMLLKLPSGHVFLVQELDHLIEIRREMGPTVYVDAACVAELGAGPLVNEVMEALDLSPQLVEWVAPSETQEAAIDLVNRTARFNAGKT